jgi:hypothetical protein
MAVKAATSILAVDDALSAGTTGRHETCRSHCGINLAGPNSGYEIVT